MIHVRDLMTTDLYTLRADESMRAARLAMTRHHVRHMPVVDATNGFVGLLSQRDVLAATVSRLADIDASSRDELEGAIPVSEIMTTDVVAVEAGTNLREAAQFLLDHKYGCLPVLDAGNVVGIVTEADFLKLVVHLIEEAEEEGLEDLSGL